MKNIGSTDLVALYQSGSSTTQISAATGISLATVWRRLNAAGVMRNPRQSVLLAISQGRAAAKLRGRGSFMSADGEARFREASKAAKLGKGRGWRITSQGYVQFTMGEHAERPVHRVIVEQDIGRSLREEEVVHHVDGDRQNNSLDNLLIMTASQHAALHRRQENSVAPRRRNPNGTYSKSGVAS